MKTLKIDEKWSVEYDPDNNDLPVNVLRHGQPCRLSVNDWKNDSFALFHALLDARKPIEMTSVVFNKADLYSPELSPEQGQKLRDQIKEHLEKAHDEGFFDLAKKREINLKALRPMFIIESTPTRDTLSNLNYVIKPDLAQMAIDIHAANVVAGWWTDINTGESVLHTRNRPEMLMLAVSELAEAAEGAAGAMDDKLPYLPMYDVELADFAIRQFDQIGAEVSAGAKMPDWERLVRLGECADLFMPTEPELKAGSRSDRLMELVKIIARAMEDYRKGRVEKYVKQMAIGILTALRIAEIEHINLLDVMAQKRAYNATRPDHKIENRLQPGGKAF